MPAESLMQLYVGLGASCVLLITALFLIQRGRLSETRLMLESTGLLQLTWLIGQEPTIAERIAEVEEPTQDQLRRAGMFDVQMSYAVQRRKTKSSAELGGDMQE